MIEYERIGTYGENRPMLGYRTIYKLSEELETDNGVKYSHVCADYAITPDRGPETMLFACDEDGAVIDWMDLWADYSDTASNDMAVAMFCKMMNEEVSHD